MTGRDGARALEIGKNSLFAATAPDRHCYYYGFYYPPGPDEPGARPIATRTLGDLLRALRGDEFDIVVLYPHRRAPWSPDTIGRVLARSRVIHLPSLALQAWGSHFGRLARNKPVVVVDFDDSPRLPSHWLPLLRKATLIFKRELPVDHWATFTGIKHRDLPSTRFRARSPLAPVVAKLRPISLGVPKASEAIAARLTGVEKTTDVFFAGSLKNWGTVRERGAAQLRRLADEGVRVEIPDRILPLGEFLARCAAAWLVWSPQGLGWDCFRHYEAAACGAVPVINNPTIERHRPLMHGTHCLYYDVEDDGLLRTIRAALADKDRLRAMGEAARAHVAAHHTLATLGRHVMDETLAAYAAARR